MAGLLDMFNDPQQAGLLSTAAQMLAMSGPSRTPTSFGQIAGGGLLAGMQGMQQAQDADFKRKYMQSQMSQNDLQTKLYGMKVSEMERDQERERGLLNAYKSFGTPDISSVMAAPGRVGPTPERATLIPQQPDMSNPYKRNLALAQHLESNGFAGEASKLYEQAEKFRPKVKNWQEVRQGDQVLYAPFFEDGSAGAPVPMEVARKMEFRDMGGTVGGIDPYTGKQMTTFKKTMSPDAVASNALGWANHDLAKQTADRPQFVEGLGGFVSKPTAGAPAGAFTPLAGISPKSNATEDERKAAGWLSQADNAWKNMQSVMFSKDGKLNAGVVKPGTLETSFASIGLDEAANNMRSADRQKFVQASSSLSEALLRAATGAGINAFEAQQKVNELTPRMTDKPEVVQQKMEAIPMYLESLKTRAGRALPSGFGTGTPTTAAANTGIPSGWSVTER